MHHWLRGRAERVSSCRLFSTAKCSRGNATDICLCRVMFHLWILSLIHTVMIGLTSWLFTGIVNPSMRTNDQDQHAGSTTTIAASTFCNWSAGVLNTSHICTPRWHPQKYITTPLHKYVAFTAPLNFMWLYPRLSAELFKLLPASLTDSFTLPEMVPDNSRQLVVTSTGAEVVGYSQHV